MIVFAEQETGTEQLVLYAHQILIGTEKAVLLVMEVDYGTH
jgi:hypothetical protein